MKTLLIVLLSMISSLCNSQIKLAVDKVDDFEGTVMKSTSPSKCFKGEKIPGVLYIGAGRVDETRFIILMITNDLGCLSEYNGRAMFKLVDGSIVEVTQVTDTDCNDIASARYVPIKRENINNPDFESIIAENLEKLETVAIEKIRIYGSEYYADYIPNEKFKDFDSKEVLIKHFNRIK